MFFGWSIARSAKQHTGYLCERNEYKAVEKRVLELQGDEDSDALGQYVLSRMKETWMRSKV